MSNNNNLPAHRQAIAAARKTYNPQTYTEGTYGFDLIEDGAKGLRLMALAGIDRVTIDQDDDTAADGHTHRFFFNGRQVGAQVNGETVIYHRANAAR
jgi:hypothetical protein